MKNKILHAIPMLVIIFLTACSTNSNKDTAKDSQIDTVQLAAEIHTRVLTLDSHCDSPMWLMHEGFNIADRHDPYETYNKVDLPRMIEGGLDASFFAVFLGQRERTQAGNDTAKADALEIFNAVHKAIKDNDSISEIALTPDDGYRIEKAGKRAIYLGLENGYPIGSDIKNVEEFYILGARYITICHSRNNDICDSANDTLEHNGLSTFGEEVVQEMNRLGMIIDVSHISDSSFYDVLALSNTPVVATHSCARAICDNPRNLSDEMLVDLAKNGGVIQMCILSAYVKTPPPNPARDSAREALRIKYNNWTYKNDTERDSAWAEWFRLNEIYPQPLATVSDVADHIDHIVKIAGIDHVGIGTDFDGGGGVEGCFDASEMGNITLELVKRGYTESEIEKIWSGNFMRVFREVEKIAGK